jgi:all-trans-retinol dehydrogenase (NAD+)
MGGTILDMDLDAVLRVWRVNALSHYVTLQEFLPALIKKGHGHIVTVASSASYMSIPHLSPYATSKAAALSLHEALTGELRARYPNARKIRTSVACPTKGELPAFFF